MRPHLPSAALWRTFRADWWGILKRTWAETNDHNIGLIAAGTAFYTFSSIAPILAASVLVYGLVASPIQVAHDIRALFATLPDDAASLIGGQLDTVASGSQGKKGLGLLVAFVLALYGGSKAATSMMTALNVACDVKETRGLVQSYLTAFGIVGGGVLLMLVGAVTPTVTAFLSSLMPWAPSIVLTAIGLSSYLVLALLAVTGASALYRFGPSLPPRRFRWGTPGAVLATLLWLAGSTGFALYVANFANYNATYGSLGAIVVLLTWLWLSVFAFLLGAELDDQVGELAPPAAAASAPVPAAASGSAPAPAPGVAARVGLSALGLVLMLRGKRGAARKAVASPRPPR